MGWARSATQEWWNAGLYGVPVGLGVVTGMIWNRRDGLCAPFLATLIVVGAWSSGGAGSFLELARQLREYAKWLRSVLSGGMVWLYEWLGVIKSPLFLASLTMVYWKTIGWIVGRLKIATATAGRLKMEPLHPTETVDTAATAVSTLMSDESIGTGMAVAARASTPSTLVVSGERLDAEKEMSRDPFHYRRESSDATLAGCVRARLPALAFSGRELEKYFLLEDDGLAGRPAKLEDFPCDRHGNEYITIARNKRCSHALCWRRGSLWGHEAEW